MNRLLRGIIFALRASLKSRRDLIIENLVLRQQLSTLKAERPRPRLTTVDRLFWVMLRRIWSRWASALIIVKPETVINWHRAGFKTYWRWKSKTKRRGRPKITREIRELVYRMGQENPIWGAPRIHAELLKLGFDVSERTISRYLCKRPSGRNARQSWKTFLHNHRDAIAAMDFFTVHTATFRVLYVFFVIHHERRRILHSSVSANPDTDFIIQQLREAFPYDTAPRYLILDRDTKFSRKVMGSIDSMGIEAKRIAYQSPWQNGVAERWVSSVRRELLNHVIVLNEAHLRRLLKEYVAYYNEDRTHLTLEKDTPAIRPTTPRLDDKAHVISLPRVGGLHHRYIWSEVA